jgi:hypothetical protein
VHAKNLIRLLLHDKLHKAVRVVVGLGTRVGNERELADLVFDAFLLEVFFRTADPCDLFVPQQLSSNEKKKSVSQTDLGVSVDDGRNGVVVDVAMASLDVLDRSNT